jgi:hypothetical protein
VVAWHIADILQLKIVGSTPANHYIWGDEHCVIKTARVNTDLIKIPKMLYESISVGIVAREVESGVYDLYKVSKAMLNGALEECKGKSAKAQWAFRLNKLLGGMQPFNHIVPVEYRIESYWPNQEEREYSDEYYLWVHDDKFERVNSIPAGSKILFYETEKNSEGAKCGAMTVFAAGTLTDRLVSAPLRFEDSNGKAWRQYRVVELDAWVKPENGVPFDELRGVLGYKKGWAMQTCPYPIQSKSYQELHRRLLSCSGVRKNPVLVADTSVTPAKDEREVYGSLSLRIEEAQIRQRAAGIIQARVTHNILTNSFRKYCKDRWGITPTQANFDALLEFDKCRILIEAKSTAVGGEGRQQIREAIGQLHDYRFEHWGEDAKPTVLAVLLPDIPPDYVKDLLASLGIGVIWRAGENFRFDNALATHLPKTT